MSQPINIFLFIISAFKFKIKIRAMSSFNTTEPKSRKQMNEVRGKEKVNKIRVVKGRIGQVYFTGSFSFGGEAQK